MPESQGKRYVTDTGVSFSTTSNEKRFITGKESDLPRLEVGEIIETRRLYLENEPDIQLIVNIGRPIESPDHRTNESSVRQFICPVQILPKEIAIGMGRDQIICGVGADGVAALQSALWLIARYLEVLGRECYAQRFLQEFDTISDS